MRRGGARGASRRARDACIRRRDRRRGAGPDRDVDSPARGARRRVPAPEHHGRRRRPAVDLPRRLLAPLARDRRSRALEALTTNWRNTYAIWLAAQAFIEGESFDDLEDDELETRLDAGHAVSAAGRRGRAALRPRRRVRRGRVCCSSGSGRHRSAEPIRRTAPSLHPTNQGVEAIVEGARTRTACRCRSSPTTEACARKGVKVGHVPPREGARVQARLRRGARRRSGGRALWRESDPESRRRSERGRSARRSWR